MNAYDRRSSTLSTADWQVEVHRDPAPLEAAWRRLEADGRATVFQTFDWVSSWYETARRVGEAQPVIVTIRRGDGTLHWILPLCLHRRQGLRIISFADLGSSDYAAPVFAQGMPLDAAENRALMAAVRKALPPCDIIHLQKLPEKVQGAPNPMMSLEGLVRLRENAYGIAVDRPWAELKKEITQPRLRTNMRQQRNKLERLGTVTLEHVVDPGAIGPVLAQMMRMRSERYAQIGRPDMSPDWQRFYDTVATRPDRTLDVSVTMLRVDGEAIAACFGLTRDRAYHVILPTFAMDKWSSFSPGTLLFDEMLTQFGAEGRGYFDFTIGDEPYKQRMGGVLQPLFEWMAPASPKGWLGYAYWRTKVRRREKARLRQEQEAPA